MNDTQLLAVAKYLGSLGLSHDFNVLYSLANEIKVILEINAKIEPILSTPTNSEIPKEE